MLQYYADKGTCQCRDVASCPKFAKDCACPTGLDRICETCQIGMDANGTKCATPGAHGCNKIPAYSCPASECTQWGCSCFDPTTKKGTLGQVYTDDEHTGTATCLVSDGKPQCLKGNVVEDETQCCRNAHGGQQPDHGICQDWNANGTACMNRMKPEQDGTYKCGITSCCGESGNKNIFGPANKQEETSGSDMVTCSAQYENEKITLSCTLQKDASDDTVLQGQFSPAGPGTRTHHHKQRVGGRGKKGMVAAEGRRRRFEMASLKELVQLLDRGLLSPEEFIAMKRDLMHQIDAAVDVSSGTKLLLTGTQSKVLLHLLSSVSGRDQPSSEVQEKAPRLVNSVSMASPSAAHSQRRLLGPPGGGNSYDGGYVLLVTQVQFSKCGQSCQEFSEMLEKSPQPQDFSNFTFQDQVATAFSAHFPSHTFSFAGIQSIDSESINVFWKVQSSTERDSNGLFDLDVFSRATILANETSIRTASECCGLQVQGKWGSCGSANQCSANAALQNGTTSIGLMQLPIFTQDTLQLMPSVCGDGTVQSFDHIQPLLQKLDVEDDIEECDLGHSYNNKYSACSDGNDSGYQADKQCKCNSKLNFRLDSSLGSTCMCHQKDPEVCKPTVFTGSESNPSTDANNDITLSIDFQDKVIASTTRPMVIEIVGLTGSQTSTTQVDVDCIVPFESSCNLTLGVLKPDSSNLAEADAWTWGKGDWTKDTGTLKFTVLSNIQAKKAGATTRLALKIRLKNRAEAQKGVRPYLRICGRTSWPAEIPIYAGFDPTRYSGQPLLASNGFVIDGTKNCTEGCAFQKVNAQGLKQAVASIFLGVLDNSSSLKISLTEAVVGRGVSSVMKTRLPKPGPEVTCNPVSVEDPSPTCSSFAGLSSTMLDVKLNGVQELSSGVAIQMAVDSSVVRRRGGCYTTATKTLTICLPGLVDLYRFNESSKAWETDTPPLDLDSVPASVSKSGIKSFSTWTPLATPKCCDYEGTGKACGDKVCLLPGQATKNEVRILLGDGTLTKMPSVGLTDRPAFKTIDEIKNSYSSSSGSTSALKIRSGWQQMCPSGPDETNTVHCDSNLASQAGRQWFPARHVASVCLDIMCARVSVFLFA